MSKLDVVDKVAVIGAKIWLKNIKNILHSLLPLLCKAEGKWDTHTHTHKYVYIYIYISSRSTVEVIFDILGHRGYRI